MKRVFDIFFSMVALSVFSLPMILIVLALKFREKHAILFKQERIGRDRQPFEILKFQTLVNDVPTKTGAILRKTGLDELPQFINVLRGDMSIVGPRALTQSDIDRLGWDRDYYDERWSVKPGITGFAQLYGGQHRKTSWFWDRRYVSRSTLFADFGVIVCSFLINLFGKTRVRNMIWPHRNLK